MSAIASRPDVDLGVWAVTRSATERLASYESLVTRMFDEEVEIPPDSQLRSDLLAIRQKLTPNGFTIRLPQTPDGRHADYAPSVVLALSKCLVDPEDLGPLPGTPQYFALQERPMEERMWRQPDERYAAEQVERRYWRDVYGVEWRR